MSEISLVVVFNHHHAEAKKLVQEYNSRFNCPVHIAAPFDGEEIIRYSSGSYLWQGAIVEYLSDLKNYDGYTLFIHDDLVLNAYMQLSELEDDEPHFIRLYHSHKVNGISDPLWPWTIRALTNWFTPKHQSFGTGVDDVVQILKGSLVYKRNRIYIDSLNSSKFVLESGRPPLPEILSVWIDRYFPGRTEFDFGLPLYAGISDFFMFPNTYASEIEDFLRRSIECGLFVEIAIPTLVHWLGLPVHHGGNRQLFPLGSDWNMFNHLRSIEEIEQYFVEHPELLSIHPVKFSRFKEIPKG